MRNYIEVNIGTKLMDLHLKDDFMNSTPQSREVKAKINEGDYVKFKNFCTAKETAKKPKGNQQKGKRYLQTTGVTRC